MDFKKCENAELQRVLDFYRHVVQRLKASVNYPKWGVHHPSVEDLTGACDRGELYVCTEDGEVCGAVVLNEDPEGYYEAGDWSKTLSRGEFLVIHLLASDPDIRNKGIGGLLVDRCVDIARKGGYKAVRLDVVPCNEPAINLYKSKGFTYAGTKDLKRDIKAIPVFALYELVLE